MFSSSSGSSNVSSNAKKAGATQPSNAIPQPPRFQSERITSLEFSTQKYTQFLKMEQEKKRLTQSQFKGLVEQIIDRRNWKQRWTTIKTFINQSSNQGSSAAQIRDRNQQSAVYSLVLALYAGEEIEEVFNQLDIQY